MLIGTKISFTPSLYIEGFFHIKLPSPTESIVHYDTKNKN